MTYQAQLTTPQKGGRASSAKRWEPEEDARLLELHRKHPQMTYKQMVVCHFFPDIA